jgi:hypothetical protein
VSPIARVLLRPRVNLAGAAISAVAEVVSWFTTFDDPYRVTPLAFGLCCLFLSLFGVHEHLEAEQFREAAKSKLTLVLGNDHVYDSLHGQRSTVRKLRVGVLNSGDTVHNVAVKVVRVEPRPPDVFPMQELQQTNAGEGESRFTVNKSDEPLVFVELIRQEFRDHDGEMRGSIAGVPYRHPYKKGEMFNMLLAIASEARRLALNSKSDVASKDAYADQYLIWLAIDGPGAQPTRKFVLRRNAAGQYDLSEAFA